MRIVVALAAVLGVLTFGRDAAAAPADDFRRAEAMIGVERFDRALAILKQVEVAAPEDAIRLDLALGRIFLGLGEPSRACEFFEDAAGKSMDDAEALAGLARCELAMGRLRDAARDANSALESDSGSVPARLVLAVIAERLGKRADGDRMLAAMASDMPDSEDVAVARAQYTSETSRSQAVALLEDFVRRHPFAAAAEDALGRTLWNAGKRDIGLDHRRHAADTFAAKGNTARAEAIRAWVDGAAALPVERKPQRLVPGGGKANGLAPPPQREASAQAPSNPVAPIGLAPNAVPAWPFKPDWTGSGIVLEGGRLILTNRHVVENGSRFAVRNGLNQMRTAKVYAVTQRADLAVLELDEPLPGVDGFPLSQLVIPRAGRKIFTMGYPIGDVLGDDAPSITEGSIAKETGFGENPTTFQMTARIQHGNSGGPIFDAYGDWVGLSVETLNAALMSVKIGQEISPTWFGVNAQSIAEFLKVPLATEPPSRDKIDPEELYQQSLGYVVLVAGKK